TQQAETEIIEFDTPFGPARYQYHRGGPFGVAIRQIMPDGELRLASIVGMGMGTSWQGNRHNYIWIDKNGNGRIDVEQGEEAGPDSELAFIGGVHSYYLPTFDRHGG